MHKPDKFLTFNQNIRQPRKGGKMSNFSKLFFHEVTTHSFLIIVSLCNVLIESVTLLQGGCDVAYTFYFKQKLSFGDQT